jgi:hypothetical protein
MDIDFWIFIGLKCFIGFLFYFLFSVQSVIGKTLFCRQFWWCNHFGKSEDKAEYKESSPDSINPLRNANAESGKGDEYTTSQQSKDIIGKVEDLEIIDANY